MKAREGQKDEKREMKGKGSKTRMRGFEYVRKKRVGEKREGR